AGVKAGGSRPVHAGGPAEALEDANDAGGDIDLPGIGAMPGAGGIGMVHVVPALAEGEQRQRQQVGGAVVAARSDGGVAEQPAHVRMGETTKLPGQAGSVPVGRMRVARLVGKRVMTAVD